MVPYVVQNGADLDSRPGQQRTWTIEWDETAIQSPGCGVGEGGERRNPMRIFANCIALGRP